MTYGLGVEVTTMMTGVCVGARVGEGTPVGSGVAVTMTKRGVIEGVAVGGGVAVMKMMRGVIVGVGGAAGVAVI